MHLFHSSPPRRSGVILLIVVIMLALFLVVGLSFMLYAESEASASRIYREAFTINYDRADIEPQTLLNWAMGQLVYDVSDYGDGVYSALRGHSLARNMYGWNYTTNPADLTFVNAANNNYTPFNGYGRLDSTLDPPPPGMPANTDVRQLINYTFFANPQNPGQAFIRDPERVGVRTGTGSVLDWPSTVRVDNPTTPNYSGGLNVPYTYPDRNNVFLAALKANDPYPNGSPRVLLPSFHRPKDTLFDVQNPNTTQLTNPAPWLTDNATDPSLKYKVLRPRPADMYYDPANPTRSFPLPASDTGDVQNLPGGNGFDSYWIDLGYPVNVTRGGTKFKPLFAFLVVDLDNRVNLNVHGNIRGQGNTHASNQGWGRWEVNPAHVLNANAAEVQNLFVGSGASNPGRYGPNGIPGGSGTFASPIYESYPLYPYTETAPPWNPTGTEGVGMLAPYLTRVDIDGVDEFGQLTTRLRLPSEVPNPPYHTGPQYTPPVGYDSMVYSSSASPSPQTVNPGLYNVLAAGRAGVNGNDDTPFDIAANLYYLIGQAAGPNHTRSQLYQLGLTANLAQPRIRHMLTTLSYDLDVAGARPWVTNPTELGKTYVLQEPQPTDPATRFVPMAQKGYDLTPGRHPSAVNPAATPIPGSDFLPGDGRCAVLPRLDMNRKLASYFQLLPTGPGPLLPVGTPPTAGQPPATGTVLRAIYERQRFAEEIFDRLLLATGAVPIRRLDGTLIAPPLATANPPSPEYNAQRYLAQLAVNIVDYLDDDEFMTPFIWNPANTPVPPSPPDIVYGAESPKVVLNEIYAEIRNAQGDDGPSGGQQPFRVHFWMELFNTHADANVNPTNLNDPRNLLDGVNRGYARLQVPNPLNPTQGQAAYRIRVLQETMGRPNMRALANVAGDPEFVNQAPAQPMGLVHKTSVTNWNNPMSGWMNNLYQTQPQQLLQIRGNDGTATCPQEDNRGLYVIASDLDIDSETTPKLPTNRVATMGQEGLSYQEPNNNGAAVPKPSHTIVLQRLLCPSLPYNPLPPDAAHNPNLPLNPYVTVDYVSSVIAEDAVKMKKDALGLPTTNQTPGGWVPYADRRSFGRVQPIAASTNQRLMPQTNPPPTHTLFNPNDFAGVPPFDWLVHLDRPPVSAMDLLHVSGFKPHEITQTFFDNGQKFQHSAPWRNNQSRLYRALEYLTVGDRGFWTAIASTGTPQPAPSSGGRVPGKINVNTVWDKEVLMALTDPKPANQPSPNYFDQSHVDQSWSRLAGRRSRHLVLNPDPVPPMTQPDNPFAGFANPGPLDAMTYPAVSVGTELTVPGFDGTMLANALQGSPAMVFQGPITLPPPAPNNTQSPPAVVQEMIAKMANNSTSRSNTFAVYLTVGFFEVMDDTVRPVRLGAEIRTRNGTPIRHKMFAIVDRTHLATDPASTETNPALRQGGIDRFGPGPSDFREKVQFFLTSEESVFPEETQPAPIGTLKQSLRVVGNLTNPMQYEGKSITLPGTFTLYADVGPRQEILTGCQILNGQLVVPNGFRFPHSAGFTLSYLAPGNPGPQATFSVKDARYEKVIPYSVIIQ